MLVMITIFRLESYCSSAINGVSCIDIKTITAIVVRLVYLRLFAIIGLKISLPFIELAKIMHNLPCQLKWNCTSFHHNMLLLQCQYDLISHDEPLLLIIYNFFTIYGINKKLISWSCSIFGMAMIVLLNKCKSCFKFTAL